MGDKVKVDRVQRVQRGSEAVHGGVRKLAGMCPDHCFILNFSRFAGNVQFVR